MRKVPLTLTIILSIYMVACSKENTQQKSPNNNIREFSHTTFVMSPCKKSDNTPYSDTEEITGIVDVINIYLPMTLDFSNTIRQVTFNPDKRDPFKYDNPLYDKHKDNEINKSVLPPVLGSSDDFHVWLKKYGNVNSGYIAIKIINPAFSNYTFYELGGIRGVGLGSIESSDILCGARPVKETGGGRKPRQIAIFYVNLAKKFPDATPTSLTPGASFNIGLRPVTHLDTPIFVDPKVRNDG